MAKKVKTKPSIVSRIFSKLLVLIIIALIGLIALKSNANLRNYVYKNIFQNNISFAKINAVYKKYFGSSLPLIDNANQTSLVSTEKLEYTNISKYKDGAKLTVKENYLVPSMDSGIVIFQGQKEGYGNTVIIQRADDVEVWYCHLKQMSVNLYDYVKKGENLGETDGTELYMVYTKEGKTLDYTKYL